MALWSSAAPAPPKRSRCPDLTAFFGVAFERCGSLEVGLHPVLSTGSPDFDDVSMGGASFDVRKVRATSFPTGLNDDLFKGREFVVVKHPRVEADEVQPGGTLPHGLLSELVTELQVLCHPPLKRHDNIVDFLALMYHDAGEIGRPIILPALVTEYAELGSLKSYQANGYLSSLEDKLSACVDGARGLQVLHECGIVHGDVKSSNFLVCRHPSRKFVVKLTDFGYSISIDDDRLVGFTPLFEAPEAGQALERRYLPQLDMYSYGLLLFEVLNRGRSLKEMTSHVKEDSHGDIVKIKNLSLLVALTQLNLLLNMPTEKCLLLLLCKILAFSLQPSPAHRFRSMARVVELLDLVYLSTPSSSDYSQQPYLSPDHIERGFKAFEPMVESYVADIYNLAEETARPLLLHAKTEALKRAKMEMILYHSRNVDGLGHGVEASRCFVKGYLALREESGLAGSAVSFSDPSSLALSGSKLNFSTTFMPDIPNIAGVLRRAPWAVQTTAVHDLERISMEESDSVRRADATLNLACVFVNGLSIESNLFDAACRVLDAAKLGNIKAQSLYATVFGSIEGGETVDPDTLRTWLEKAAELGDPAGLRMLRGLSADSWTQVVKKRYQKELLDGPASTSSDTEPRQFFEQRQTFHSAVVSDRLDLIESLLHVNPGLVHEELAAGETALLISSRLGLARVTKLLLRGGADSKQQDHSGVSPLHWLVSFSSSEQAAIAAAMVEKGADLNAFANRPVTLTHSDEQLDRSTPLHWAVRGGDVGAVDVLMKLGASATFRPPATGDEVHLSPFELACKLCCSSILQRFLQDPTVVPSVNESRPLHLPASVYVRPLFYALRGGERWERLLRHGVNFEAETKETIRLLTRHGSDASVVLEASSVKMTAAFATAYHRCNADLMRSGLECGDFKGGLDHSFGTASSGGTALFLAITHGDRKMFRLLLDAGANHRAVDMYGMDPLCRAAKETDDVYFAEQLLQAGSPLEPQNQEMVSAFYMATYAGNYSMARYFYDQGANRDRIHRESGLSKTILGDMLFKHTRSSARRVEFLLSLPDRGSDGFMVAQMREDQISAYHLAVPMIGENPNDAETTRIMITLLLEKYSDPYYLNNTSGPHHDSAIGLATEVGNYKVLQVLLQRGADPNVEDEYGRTALDKLFWRYCYPGTTEALKEVDLNDELLVARTLDYVNRNTSEILSLLQSYGARINVFRAPGWFRDDPGYRSLEWVLQRLRENRSSEGQARQADTTNAGVPNWGGLPIRVPDRPMQFSVTSSTQADVERSTAQPLAAEAATDLLTEQIPHMQHRRLPSKSTSVAESDAASAMSALSLGAQSEPKSLD